MEYEKVSRQILEGGTYNDPYHVEPVSYTHLADVYDDICDQIDGKDNGEYILLSKFDDDVVFEYHITIQEEDFNLGILKMKTPEGEFVADFDA